MKFTCTKRDLSHGLSIVGHAVPSRSTLPILANILFATDHGRLKLTATDLEIGINCWVDAEISEEGSVTLPAKLMTEFVNSLPQGSVELTLLEESHTVNVKGGPSSANIRGMDPEEFPRIDSVEEDTTPIQIGATLLKEVIGQVTFAASDDISRPALTGVMLQASEEHPAGGGRGADPRHHESKPDPLSHREHRSAFEIDRGYLSQLRANHSQRTHDLRRD